MEFSNKRISEELMIMINCEIIKKDANRTYFKTTIVGNGFDTLSELMRINSEFVMTLRKHKVPEGLIEKKLVDCVHGGFAMADHYEEES